MSPLRRSWRVVCQALDHKAERSSYGAGFCLWTGGTRRAETREQAELKPCPRCGGPVDAVEPRPRRR
jgi:hypothetical protein